MNKDELQRLENQCPLCLDNKPVHYANTVHKTYLHCPCCQLLYCSRKDLPSAETENNRYQQHRNDSSDQRYRNFLSRLTSPLADKLTAQSQGLDFGCGPSYTLAEILREQGHSVACYDPFFSNSLSLLNQKYDFICCSEVFEHLHYPVVEIDLLARLLKPKGWLGVMTEIKRADIPFDKWAYIRDVTHVSFYSIQTMNWIAEKWKMRVENPRENVFLFQKSE